MKWKAFSTIGKRPDQAVVGARHDRGSGRKVRISFLTIIAYVTLGLLVLLIASDFEARYGNLAQGLSLTGSGVIPFIPWAGVAVYAVIVFATRKTARRWVEISRFPAALLLAGVCAFYPSWLFKKYSKKIEISSFVKGDEMFLPADEIADFERTFNTPTIQFSGSGGGPWLIVPQDKFSQAMVSFLRDNAHKKNAP